MKKFLLPTLTLTGITLVAGLLYFNNTELGVATESGFTRWYGLDSLVIVSKTGSSEVLLGFENGTCVFEKADYRKIKKWIEGTRYGRYFQVLPSGEIINLLYIDSFEEIRRYSRCDEDIFYADFVINFTICSNRCNGAICNRLSRVRDQGIKKVSSYMYKRIIGQLEKIDPGSGDIWRGEKTRVRKLCPAG